MRLNKEMLDEMEKDLKDVIQKNRCVAGPFKGVSIQQSHAQKVNASSPSIAGGFRSFDSDGVTVNCDQINGVRDEKRQLMMALPDKNMLIALPDTHRIHHEAVVGRMEAEVRNGPTSCPITQNSCVQIM
ncbi:MAG: hypothetical protein ACUVS3_14705 [Thermodesulfobacteriota bacterium]